jgi:hypothetical protein
MSTDITPSAREELASSPSSSETSIAKENKLSGKSYSCEEEKKSEILPKDRYGYYKSNRSIGLPASRQFLGSGLREQLEGGHVKDRQRLPMGYLL